MSMPIADMVGWKHGRLEVMERAGKVGARSAWRCRCECGQTVVRTGSALKQGLQSCGCLSADAPKTHGESRTPLYDVWCAMHQRCSNPNNKLFHRYGGRGIAVHPRWKRYESFRMDMEPRPAGAVLDRIDNDGGYSSGNCRWSTQQQSARNRSSNRIIHHAGKALCVTEWAEQLGVSKRTILGRLNRGWSVADALTKPVRR